MTAAPADRAFMHGGAGPRSFADLPGFPEPTWEDVERRMDEFEPWPETRLLVDSAEDFDENLRRVIAFVTRPE
jgi:hypothetical protein